MSDSRTFVDTNVFVYDDLQIAATMLGNGVRRIITFNAVDFERFEELSVVAP